MGKLITHVGQKLWLREEMARRRGEPGKAVVVTRVGRLWAGVSPLRDDGTTHHLIVGGQDWWKIDAETLMPKDGSSGQGDRFYLSREAWEEERDADKLLHDIQTAAVDLRNRNGRGAGKVSLDQLRHVLSILNGG